MKKKAAKEERDEYWISNKETYFWYIMILFILTSFLFLYAFTTPVWALYPSLVYIQPNTCVDIAAINQSYCAQNSSTNEFGGCVGNVSLILKRLDGIDGNLSLMRTEALVSNSTMSSLISSSFAGVVTSISSPIQLDIKNINASIMSLLNLHDSYTRSLLVGNISDLTSCVSQKTEIGVKYSICQTDLADIKRSNNDVSNLTNNLNSCQVSLTQSSSNYMKSQEEKNYWAIGGVLAGFIGYYLFKNKRNEIKAFGSGRSAPARP